MCCGSETGSYLRLIDSCITQLKAQGPSRTCNESKEEEEEEEVEGVGSAPPCHAVQGVGFSVWGMGFRESNLGSRIWGFGVRGEAPPAPPCRRALLFFEHWFYQ